MKRDRLESGGLTLGRRSVLCGASGEEQREKCEQGKESRREFHVEAVARLAWESDYTQPLQS
jgi:hypothetical protein